MLSVSQEVPMSPRDIQKALDILIPPMREFFATQLATGCRKAELSALNVDDFDVTAGLLRISRTRSRHEETETMTNRKREVDLAPTIVAMLMELLGGRKDGRLFDVGIDRIQSTYEELGITSHHVRYFRLAHLENMGADRAIQNYWLGRPKKNPKNNVHEDREQLTSRLCT